MLIKKVDLNQLKDNLKKNCVEVNNYLEKRNLFIASSQIFVINKKSIAKLLQLNNCERVYFQQNLYEIAEDIKTKRFNKKYTQVIIAQAIRNFSDLQAYLEGKSLKKYNLIFQLASYFLKRRIKVVQANRSQIGIKKQIYGQKKYQKIILLKIDNHIYSIKKNQQKKINDNRLTDQSETESQNQKLFLKNLKNQNSYTNISLSFMNKKNIREFEELQRLNSLMLSNQEFHNSSQDLNFSNSEFQFQQFNNTSSIDYSKNFNESILSNNSNQGSLQLKNCQQNFLVGKLQYYNRKTKKGLILAKNNFKYKLVEEMLIEFNINIDYLLELRKKNNIFFKLVFKENSIKQLKKKTNLDMISIHQIKPKTKQLIQ